MGSGSVPHVDPCAYRSIRITGRMITVADPGLDAINLDFRPVRSSGRKLMTVPISLSPRPLTRPDAVARYLPDLRGARLTVR